MSGVFYEDHSCTGTPEAATLVLLHGWGLHSGVWRDFLPLLTPQFQVRCIDLPGFGRSAAMTGPDSLDAMAEAVMLVAPEKAIWAGWSLGGLIALAIAARHPEKVAALALLAATPCFVQRQDWVTAMPADVFAAFSASVQQSPDAALQHFLALQCKGSVSMKHDLRFLQATSQMENMPARGALLAGLEVLANNDLRAVLASLSVPVLCVLGEQDALVPCAVAEAVRQINTVCTVELVVGAAHVPFVSHPLPCRDALLGLAQASVQRGS